MLPQDLPKELEQNCHRLDVKEKEFSKWHKPATGLVVLIFFSLLSLVTFLSPGQQLENLSIGAYISGTFLVVSLGVGYFCYIKSIKYSTSGFELNMVKTYRAYNMVTKYQRDNLDTQLKKAESNMNSLLHNLQNGWGDFSKKNPAFKSLAHPIDEFLKNLEHRFIPALANKNPQNIENVRRTLSSLIMFFQSDLFSDIDRINQELKQYPDVSTEKETFSEKIKNSKHIITLLLTLAIIGGGGLLALSSRLLKEDIPLESQLTLWTTISVPFTIWLLHSRYKKFIF